MAWTYSTSWTLSATLSAVGNKVRFLIGDTDTNDQLISDEEIEAVIAAYTAGTAVNYLAASCADFLAAKFARKADVSNLETSVSASQRHSQFMALAKRLREMPPGSVLGGDGSSVVLASLSIGGRLKDDLRAREEDTGLVQPAFRRGMFGNPGIDRDADEDG